MFGILAVLFAALILVFSAICGATVKCLFCRIRKCDVSFENDVFSLPIIGVASLLCVIQTLNVLFSVRVASFIFILPLLAGAVILRKDICRFFLKLKESPLLLFISFLTLSLTLLPCFVYNDLLFLHFGNNDGAYYLSSMEWLRDNSFFDPVVFSPTAPQNSLAHFMVTTTRVGTDIFGAFLLSLIPLEPHQIYLILCAVFNTLCVFAAIHLAKETLGVGERLTCLCAAFVGTGCSVTELTKQQYAPQIFGIALFTVFIACLIRFFRDGRRIEDVFRLGLTAVATISVYAEYASYAVLIFVLAFLIKAAVKRSRRTALDDFFDALKMVTVAFISNCPGFIIALRFNLSIIVSQVGSLENIDPFHGNMADLKTLLRYLLNVDTDGLGAYLGALPFIGVLAVTVAVIGSVACVCGLIHVIRGAVISVKTTETHISLGAILFFIAYWMFFRAKAYAYGEYKHIHLVLIPTAVLLVYLASVSLKNAPKTDKNVPSTPANEGVRYSRSDENSQSPALDKTAQPKAPDTPSHRPGSVYRYVLKTASVISASALVCASLINAVAFTNVSRSDYRFDSSLKELKEAVVSNVPSGETVGIMNKDYFEAHSTVYALRSTERDVSLLTEHSYLSALTAVRPKAPTYIVTALTPSGGYSDILSTEDYSVVWKNTRHCLLKNTTDVGAFIDYGFSTLDTSDPERLMRTSSESAAIAVWNTGSVNKTANVDFVTAPTSDGAARDFKVLFGETVLFMGKAGDTVNISGIVVPAGKSVLLRIEVDNASPGNGIRIHTLDTDIIY